MVLKVAKSNPDDGNKRPQSPQIEITNNSKIDKFVNGLELTFDSYFTLYGVVEIIIGDKKILSDNSAQDFKQYRVFSVPTNSQILKRDKSIKIFVWNPLTDDVVFLAANIDISEIERQSILTGQAIDNDAILSEISGGAGDESDTHDIFPYQIYRDETKEFLINTKGRQNMLLTMASSNILAPAIIDNNFTPETKPEPFQFKINSDVDNSPYVTSGVRGTYASAGTIRSRNWSVQTETEWYYITEYLDTLRDVTFQDGNIIDDATFDKFIDEYLLIDVQGTDNKELKFNFNSTAFSQDVTSGVMSIKLARITKYQRTRTAQYVTASGGHGMVKKVEVTPWTAYSAVSTSYSYSSATVMLRCKISFEIEVSDDINFAVFRKIKDVSTNGEITLNFSERYMRIKRIVTGERLIVSYGSSAGATTANLSYPDITSNYTVTNLIDLQSHGGTAKLSFALKGVNNQWFTILDSSQLGSITQGDSKLIQYDIKGIPPSQSRFKAVLEVVDSLKTGVTIDLIA